MKKFTLVLFLFSTILSAQVKAPQPSPAGKLEQKVGLTDITVEYSRPSMRGRTIFGDLVPYNKMWRTGANQNTKITFSDDVMIKGENLAKGTYAIFTTPTEENWEIIFYKDVSNWGLPQEWDESKVALKVEANTDNMPFDMETFTIVIDELTNSSAVLNFLWESTVAYLPIKVDTDKMVMESIKTTMKANPTANDYYAAANYYFEEEKDLQQALEWINNSIKMQEETPFWMLRRKSLIQAKMGNKDEAIKTAKKSLKSAQKAENEDYVKMNKESIEEWSK